MLIAQEDVDQQQVTSTAHIFAPVKWLKIAYSKVVTGCPGDLVRIPVSCIRYQAPDSAISKGQPSLRTPPFPSRVILSPTPSPSLYPQLHYDPKVRFIPGPRYVLGLANVCPVAQPVPVPGSCSSASPSSGTARPTDR